MKDASSNSLEEDEIIKKYEELEMLKAEIADRIEKIEAKDNKKATERVEKIKKHLEEGKKREIEINDKNIDKGIKIYSDVNKSISNYQKFLDAFEKMVDIDPGRLMGLTDGIFGMVMTLLIFGMALPEIELSTQFSFMNFLYSIIPNIGLTLVSFILIASFWIFHHEFIKIRGLNMPYLWLNIFFLAAISFIPFTTSIVGNYSHFFLSNVVFGANIFIVIVLFLLMFNYAYKRDFLERKVSEEEKKYVRNTLYMIMLVTIAVNLLDFNVNHNFIYLFFIVPIITTIRDIQFKINHS